MTALLQRTPAASFSHGPMSGRAYRRARSTSAAVGSRDPRSCRSRIGARAAHTEAREETATEDATLSLAIELEGQAYNRLHTPMISEKALRPFKPSARQTSAEDEHGGADLAAAGARHDLGAKDGIEPSAPRGNCSVNQRRSATRNQRSIA